VTYIMDGNSEKNLEGNPEEEVRKEPGKGHGGR
jgi:hypothetical protein